MGPAMLVETPPAFATEAFVDAGAAVARLEEIYERNTKFLRDRFEAYAHGGTLTGRVRAFYPLVRLTTSSYARLDSRLAYGFVAAPGVHETSVTRPDLFRSYLTEQIRLLIENHGVPVEIGESSVMIAVSSPHRREAFEACHFAIDTLKETVPVWKKEYFEDGEVWVGLQSQCDQRH